VHDKYNIKFYEVLF